MLTRSTLRIAQLETRVNSLVERLAKGQPIEDSLVEMKRQWPPAEKVARQLAALCNSARGELVLFLVGLDEHDGVTGASDAELSSWRTQFASCFDDVAPNMGDAINVTVGDKVVVAITFETTRAPFVVKNPEYGKQKGAFELEVPWREGTGTRSAKRSDLLKLLVPAAERPIIDVLRGHVTRQPSGHSPPREFYDVEIDLYVTPMGRVPLFFPFHRINASLRPPVSATMQIDVDPRLEPTGEHNESTENELIINGPGHVVFRGRHFCEPNLLGAGLPLRFDLKVVTAGSDTEISVQALLVHSSNLNKPSVGSTTNARWIVQGSRDEYEPRS